MKATFVSLSSLLLLLGLCSACGGSGGKTAHGDEFPAHEAVNRFALDLYQDVQKTDGNLIFSPASLSVALTMTWAGAAGHTATEMQQVLHLSDNPTAVHGGFKQMRRIFRRSNAPFTIHVANRLWGEQGFHFEDPFLTTLKDNYGAGLERLNFSKEPNQSRLVINDWVADQTHDRIKDLLPQDAITTTTRLVLTNAVYFLANWQNAFDPKMTERADFHTAQKPVKSMLMTTKQVLPYTEDADWQILVLPYETGDLDFVVMLPQGDRRREDLAAKLDDLTAKLTFKQLEDYAFALHETEVRCQLPRFKIEAQFGMNETLQSMGMTTAFDEKTADFSGMTGDDNLFISDVVHKAFIEVDEKGTEAAAATGVVVSLKSAMPEKPVQFIANHPFLFMIRHHDSRLILFMGRVTNPNAG